MYSSIFKFCPGPGITFSEMLSKSAYGKANFLFLYEDGTWEAYSEVNNEKKINSDGLNFYSSKNNYTNFKKRIEDILKNIRTSWKKIDELNFEKLSVSDIKRTLVEQEQIALKFLAVYHLTEFYYFESIDKKISDFIVNHFKDKDKNEILSVLLSSPPENNIITLEKIERLKLAKDILKVTNRPISKEKIENYGFTKSLNKHLELFDYITYKDGEKYLTIDNLISLINEDLKDSEEKIDEYLSTQEKHSKELIQKQQELEATFSDNQDILWLIKVVREMQEIKFTLRMTVNKFFFGDDAILSLILREISKRTFVAINQLEFMTLSEIHNTLNGKIDLDKAIERQDKFIYIKGFSGYKLLFGEKAKNLINTVKPKLSGDTKFLKGSIANYGVAKGKAKLIRLTTKIDIVQKQIEEMQDGQILVTETTGPELILACKKAKAIVTNEGGINSHAAIVSRELKLPCVIGTKYATEIIKDGDEIEVDANNGIVRIIK